MICQPWLVVYQQFRRWDEAGCFEAMVNDMRSVIWVSEGRRGSKVGGLKPEVQPPALTPPPTRSAPARCARCG